MKNLRLIPGFHKQEVVVKVASAYDSELIPLVKTLKGLRWSHTLRSWYFRKKEFKLNPFYQALKGKVFIDYSQLKQTTTPTKKPTSEIQKLGVKLPKGYKEQLVPKRYSQNTVKTYCKCFQKFIAHFIGYDIDCLSKKDVKTFLLYLIQEKKISSKTTEIYTHVSKKSLANIKSPLGAIIESQSIEKQQFYTNKNK